MRADGLADELAARLGSRQEAVWILEEADARGGDRTDVARALAARRAAGEPLQYVVGHWSFRGHELLVDARALIPRHETEVLVDLALERRSRAPGGVVVDLGCGTGAIAISLALEAPGRGWSPALHATDLSPDALDLARQNAARLGAQVALHLGSWFEALPEDLLGRVDLACANPPYVAPAERPGLQRELDFEPELALVAPDGAFGPGTSAVEAVLAGAARWLAPGGTVLVEHGATQGPAVVAAALAAGLEVLGDHPDLAGLDRVLEARRR